MDGGQESGSEGDLSAACPVGSDCNVRTRTVLTHLSRWGYDLHLRDRQQGYP